MMDVTLQVPLGEQMHLKEMFSALEENHMETESQNLENFLQYFDQMERYFGDMQDELLYLRDQLDRLNEKTLKAKMAHFIQNVGDRVGAAKMWLAALKNDISAGVRKAVDSVKYHGGQALYAAIDKTKAVRALSVIHEHLESAAASLEHSAETMGDIGVELNAAKGHKKMSVNSLWGRRHQIHLSMTTIRALLQKSGRQSNSVEKSLRIWQDTQKTCRSPWTDYPKKP